MRRFAQLCQTLDASAAPEDKGAALSRYLSAAPAADAAWATHLLTGGRPCPAVRTALLRETACRLAGIDDWLFDECRRAVGDLAETIAHLLPPGAHETDAGLAEWIETHLLPLRALSPAEQAVRLAAAWSELDAAGRLVGVRLVAGGLRVGVNRRLVQQAVADCAGLDSWLIAQRMEGWTAAGTKPDAARWHALVSPHVVAMPASQPYPFLLSRPLTVAPETLGPRGDWLVEWRYDGIRAQLVKRAGRVWIWSRDDELLTAHFPDIVAAAAALPDGSVLDGDLLVWLPGIATPAPLELLQRRIGRKTVDRKRLAEAPACFVASDLLEAGGDDQRGAPQWLRRRRLEEMLAGHQLRLSPLVDAPDWAACAALRKASRLRGAQGFMLRHREASHGSGGTESGGAGWTWKMEPMTVDAVLIYAQAGDGHRAGVRTDYTFAVWSRPPGSADEAQAVVEAIARREPARPGALQLLPLAKVSAGLGDDDLEAVDRVVRANTLQRFGPVRSVRPTLVVEVGFEGIDASRRHKSGVAVRSPRMLRIRHDKPLYEADALDTLRGLLPGAVP